MTKQQFNKLMDKHLNGSASPEEEQQLFEWYDTFQQKTAGEEPLSLPESEELLLKIKSRISLRTSHRKNYFLWSGIAASLIVVLLSTWLLFKDSPPRPSAELVNITTQKNKKQHLILPDGTLVWLNAGSKLQYPAQFSKAKRELWLSGEGYFEVKHDAKKPFIVHTNDIDVKVLGTIFNLKAYSGTKTEASLLRGSVEVTAHHGSKRRIILRPFQKLIAADRDSLPAGIQDISVERIAHAAQQTFIAETAWAQKAFSFSNESLQSIAAKLEKVYGIKIIIQNPKYKEERFTGTFDNAGISTVLNALQFSKEFEYRKEGESTIIIY